MLPVHDLVQFSQALKIVPKVTQKPGKDESKFRKYGSQPFAGHMGLIFFFNLCNLLSAVFVSVPPQNTL